MHACRSTLEDPTGTFIGIGDKEGKIGSVVGGDGSVPPPPAFITNPAGARRQSSGPPPPSNPPPLPRGRMPSAPAHAQSVSNPPKSTDHSFTSAQTAPGVMPLRGSHSPQVPGVLVGPSPAAVVRRIPPPDSSAPPPANSNGNGVSVRGSRPDGQEGSIPAYGNTLNFGAEDSVSDIDPRDLGMRPKSSVAVWLMAVLLAAAALGGIAFFAVKRGPLADPNNGAQPENTGTPVPTVTSAAPWQPPPPPTTPPTTITPPVPVDTTGGAGAAGKDAAVGTPTPPVVTPTPPVRPAFPWRPANAGAQAAPHPPRPPSRPTATNTGEPPPDPPKPPPPGLAPDPFGTPE